MAPKPEPDRITKTASPRPEPWQGDNMSKYWVEQGQCGQMTFQSLWSLCYLLR